MRFLSISRPGSLIRLVRLFTVLFASGIPWFGGIAAAQDFEGKTISAVEIRFRGGQMIDEARIRNFISSKAGDKYSTEKLDEDIRLLYEKGIVDDVRFLAEPVGTDKVKLIAEVTPRPVIGGVGFVGNSVFKDKKLAKVTKLEGGGVLSDEAILSARRNIEKEYEGFGYPDVIVTHRMQETNQPGVVDLVFVIDEGGKNEVRKIRFEGNNSIPAPDLRKVMKTKPKGILSWITKSGRFEVGQLDEDVDAILDYYRDKGYLRVKCPGIRREPVKDGRVDLVIPIEEGAKYTVANVGFGKMTVFTSEELYPALTLNAGKPYSASKMRADITMIRNYYGSRGYADATVTPDIRNAGPNQVNIIYRITEGGRFRVGKVNISGNTKTQDRVIRREVPLKPGDYFNSVELDTTRSRLQNLNYFNDVQVTATPGSKSYRDIDILVNEKQTGALSFGLGFSSIDSIVGYVTVEQSNFDIRNPWSFTGAGQRFQASLRAGSQRTDASVSLVEPWFLGKQLALGGELYYQDASYYSDVYDQTNAGGAVFLRWPLGEKGYVKAEYRLEQIKLSPNDIIIPSTSMFFPDMKSDVRSGVTASYVYDSRDSNITPRSGAKVDVGLNLNGTIFGGDVDTYTVRASGAKHWNLWWDTILTINGELTVVDATSGQVPVYELQALGGARNLRGFQYRDVGPRDWLPIDPVSPGRGGPGTGEVYGGKTSAYMTFEFTVPIIENIRGAAFVDMGFVNVDAWDFGVNDLYSDAGLGLRLNLPFGPLAIDYAMPVNSPSDLSDQGGQFQFYLNYQF